ncbi:MAG: S8 family serine peptidase, partial [Solirubrobacteraceae bacterium]
GTIVAESVGLVGAATLQANGFSGAGVDVAVLDVGFMNLAAARAAGEIPANAIAVDFTGNGMETVTAHGTAVAEHVADTAPGARLHLLLFEDEVDLDNAVDYVRTHGIRVVNLSVNWFGASYYDDTGPINTLINDSYDVDGVFWAVGGGNWGFRHWRGGWADDDGDGWLSFAPNDENLGLIAELSQICLVLNWNQYPDHFTGTPTRLDFYAYANGGAEVAHDSGPLPAGALPARQICFDRQAAQEPYRVRIFRASGTTTGLDMSIVTSDAAIEVAKRVPASSVVDPADAHGAFAVGAVAQSIWNQTPPPGAEPFSSRGPTTDGRPKPELVAPNRTKSLSYPTALGTSFASPIVAGVAALMLDQDPTLSNLQIRAALIAAATDLPPAGYDTDSGWGKLVAPFVPAGPDADGDAVPDSFDDCPFAADFGQADANADGIGDACQCGDLSGDGF